MTQSEEWFGLWFVQRLPHWWKRSILVPFGLDIVEKSSTPPLLCFLRPKRFVIREDGRATRRSAWHHNATISTIPDSRLVTWFTMDQWHTKTTSFAIMHTHRSRLLTLSTTTYTLVKAKKIVYHDARDIDLFLFCTSSWSIRLLYALVYDTMTCAAVVKSTLWSLHGVLSLQIIWCYSSTLFLVDST